ncbi:hypothetical protein [Burkholderia ubonensis]|uniref:hypothetical protein n=1 Tax=Burkholderia ubonensis TaxID=101571 RepID=UPI0012FB5AEA|nr:hypothetical protein [Burkholderia ubonensis]
MTFIADSVRVRLDDAEIAVVAKFKNAHMVDSADKLLVKSHKCPRRDSYCGSGCDDSTPSADHRSSGSLPKIAGNVSKRKLDLFENIRIFVDKVTKTGKVFVALARLCTTSFLAVAAFPTRLDAHQTGVSFGFVSWAPEMAGKTI